MRWLLGAMCVVALSVMGCSETTGAGGTGGDGGAAGDGGGGDGGSTGGSGGDGTDCDGQPDATDFDFEGTQAL